VLLSESLEKQTAMIVSNRLHRRDAIRLAGASLASAWALPAENRDPAGVAKKKSEEFHGLKVGMTSYSTRKLSVDDTIACCRRVGIQYIALKDVHLKLTSTQEERSSMRKKFADSGIQIVGCGVIYLRKNTEEEVRTAFEYARDIGAKTITIGVNRETVPTVSKVIKDFDLLAAIHNHGPQDKLGAFSPMDVLEWLAAADKKIGVCMDVGHTFRCGVDPAMVASKHGPRLYDIHIKDISEATAKAKGAPLGRGVIDIVGLLKALVKNRYAHLVALEYEGEGDNLVASIAECIAFERGVLSLV
jgi:inosose dehydratase